MNNNMKTKKTKSLSRIKTVISNEHQLYTVFKALDLYQYMLKKEFKNTKPTAARKKEIKKTICHTSLLGSRILIKLSKYAKDPVIKGVCNKIIDDCIEEMQNEKKLDNENTKSLQQVRSAEGM